MSEFSIEESGRTLKVRSRSASWLFGIVLLLFLGALLFLVVRSIVDGWPIRIYTHIILFRLFLRDLESAC